MKKKFTNMFYVLAGLIMCLVIAGSLFGYRTAVVLTGSMSGTYEIDDMVITKRADQYDVNDVIMFQQGMTPTTHRIVAQQDGGFVTKGDANNTVDTYLVEPYQVLGKVVASVPKAGVVLRWVKSPVVIGGFFLFAGLLIFCKDRVVQCYAKKY
ncbi:MAG: signal peptidase I [Ileibacterium sp.]|nr:signal peptidase I [Ileibacterium sp.]